MKSSKFLSVVLILLWVLLLVAEVLTGLLVWRLDMLPGKYMLILAALFALVWIGIGLMILLPRKTKGNNIRCGVGCLLATLMVVGCMAVSGVVSDVHDTMTEVAKPSAPGGIRMAVYIRADDPAESLESAKGYTFATMEGYEVQRTAHVVSYLSSKLGEEVVPVSYNGIADMLDALYAKDVDAVILNSAYLTILESVDGYSDFESRTKVLCEVELIEQVPPQSQPNPDDEGNQEDDKDDTVPVITTKPKPEDLTNTPFIVYISGSDTRSSKLTTGNSDVNILAIVNPVTKQVLLLNTPRDYYIPNPAGGGALDKLTHCGIYGAECSMQALGDLYGMGIDYYAKINFTGFETLIDAIGGITVYSDVSFSKPNVTVYEGENYFNGSQALAFARERKLLAGGDNARGKNQMKVIKAVLQKMMSGAIITKYADVLDSLEGMFETSMDRSEINSLVKMQLSDMASWNIQSFAVTGEGDSKTNYSLPGMSVYVMLPDEELVAQASGLINKVVNGEILTEADLTPVK